jgi:hypothetical protein
MQERFVEVNYLPLQYCRRREDTADPFEKESLINIAVVRFITFRHRTPADLLAASKRPTFVDRSCVNSG